MKPPLSSALRPRLRVLTALEALLFANECVCVVLFAGAAALVARRSDLGLGWIVTPLAALLALNTWALVWSAKTAQFIRIFARWPLRELPQGLPQAQEHCLLAAADAFDQGQFSRVPGLLARLDPLDWRPAQWLGLGRALALSGRMEEAAAALEKGGASARSLEGLRPTRLLGRDWGPVFTAEVPARLGRTLGVAALGLGLALGSGSMAMVLWHSLEKLLVSAPSFDASAFHVQTRGRLTLYYHDAAFRDQTADVAEAALDHDLAFLGMPADTFAPGAVKLYLCDSEQEYRRRAPTHPSWEAACADPADSAVYIYRFPPGDAVFFEVVLAHEIGHLCYYRMAGISPDDWLNEGLADYLGYDFGLGRAGIAREAWLQNNYFAGLRVKALPFGLFFKTDPHQLPDADVATFYQQGFSVVYLLIEDYGREPFLKFLRERSVGGDLDAALAASFPTIPNVAALGAVWSLFYPKNLSKTAAAAATPAS